MTSEEHNQQQESFGQEFEELRYQVESDNLSLATRRILDMVLDYGLSAELLNKAIHLRASYNHLLQEEVTPDGLTRSELVNKLIELLENMEQEFYKPEFKVKNRFYFKKEERPDIFRGTKLFKNYPSVRFKLGPLDFSLQVGRITGVVGENGNGKTTLLRIIAGELAHDSGDLSFPEIPEAKDWYDIKHEIAFIPQRLRKWHGTLKENLHFSAANHGITGADNEDSVNFIIHRLGLTRYRNSKWGDISSGYKLRFELARALVWRPKLLILDEPLANLDINTKLLFMQDLRLLADSKRYPVSILMSSQQLHEIESVVDNILFLSEGQPLYNGSVKTFGEDRLTNSFELSGEFSATELHDALAAFGNVQVKNTGQSFVVEVPKEITGNQVLGTLASVKKIQYFRDISQSTRKLFKN